MKIKQKKQLNLPQLIEYAWENDITNKEFPCDGFEDKTVIFNGIGWSEFSDEYSYNKTDFFTVEEEINIKEDTRLDELVVRYRNGNIYIFQQERINDFKGNSNIIAFYIPNDDLTLTLIWRDGKLVE